VAGSYGPGVPVDIESGMDPAAVEILLRGLPEWFRIESSIADYVEAAGRMPTLLARDGAEVVGALLLARHFPTAAEIHLMAVTRARHRTGIGRALVEAAEARMATDGVTLMSVKTLGASHPDPGYALTRLFYEALGYQPVEELLGLWPGNPCLIMVKPLAR
jgi:GNAT superfamily N-acetyltransferase